MRSLLTYVLIIFLAFILSVDSKRAHMNVVSEEPQGMDTFSPAPASMELQPHHELQTIQAPPERFVMIPQEKVRDKFIEERDDIYYLPVKDEIRTAERLYYEQEEGYRDPIVPAPELAHPSFQKFSLSEERYFSIIFDNDIFSNTDYYYTSGQALELYHPGLRILPTASLLPSAGRGSVNLYSLSLRQTLFTPVDPDKKEIQYDDRPFSSYLVLGHSRFSNNPSRHLRLTSRIDLGVIGPAALGGYVQKSMHEIEPVGWQNQISNDLAANYMIEIEKGLRLTSSLELLGRAGGNVGTLYNNLSAGASLRVSNGSGYFDSFFLQPAQGTGRSRVSYYVMLSADLRGIIYDATLQGGLFSRENSIYTIAPGDMTRAVFQSRLSAGVSFHWFHLEAEHIFLTKEFATGRNHMWSRIKASFRIG